MALTHDTSHASEARDLLCQQFQGNAGIEALLNANSVAVQSVEDALWSLQTMRLPISVATGLQLDGIGDIVGQPRIDLMNDANYLLWLQARLLANNSVGAPETLISIAKFITENANIIELRDHCPAGLVMWIGGSLDSGVDPQSLAAILAQAVAGGVNLQMVYSLVSDADTFTFASGDSEEASTTQGWADYIEYITNSEFADWTAGAPNGWTVQSSPPSSDVEEVGSGAPHGDNGTGSCNLYSDGSSTAGIAQNIPSLVTGDTYELSLNVSYFSGGVLFAFDGGGEFYQYFSSAGVQVLSFTAPPSGEIDLTLSIPYGDDTIDYVHMHNVVPGAFYGGQFADVEECY
jgi:hypothetical protein